MNKKYTIKDYFFITLLIITLIEMAIFLVKPGYLLGSQVDWDAQHAIFPEYFRTLFYNTHDLFPDFAFHLGAGQNIYNFSYYGLLNPIIFVSYLFPSIKMVDYIAFTSFLTVLISVLMFYRLLRNHEENSFYCFIASFLFLCATPLLYHMHRHIMYINYMPFLLLGLFAIDKYFDTGKKGLLALSTFLMIMTSYYFSIGGILTFVIYGVYRYLKKTTHFSWKDFFKEGMKFIIPIIIGICAAGILILPTFYVILNGRGATNLTTPLNNILVPKISFENTLYNPYGVGLPCIVVPAILYLLIKKKKEFRFLGIVLLSFNLFPVIVYLLNAGMYLDGKVLIPLLPLYAIAFLIFFKDLVTSKLSLKWIIPCAALLCVFSAIQFPRYAIGVVIDVILTTTILIIFQKKRNIALLSLFILFLSCGITYGLSMSDEFAPKAFFKGKDYNNESSLIKEITDKEPDIYRISDQIDAYQNSNRNYRNINYYHSNLYSSIYNKEYNQFFYDVMNNPIQSRNRVIMSGPKNPLFLLLTGNKYLLSKKSAPVGYEQIKEKEGVKAYQSDNVFPIGFASSSLLSEREFKSIEYPYNQDVLLNNVIVKDGTTKNPISMVQPYDLELEKEYFKSLNVTKKRDHYYFDLKKDMKIKIPLKQRLENKILFLRFDVLEAMSCQKGDLSIKINGINNKLTCNDWKYHNQNYTFDYILSTANIEELDIQISKGTYKIRNIESYLLDYDQIKNASQKVDPFYFDKQTTLGNNIKGNIDVQENGYFVISIPYDKGFHISLDGKEIQYEKANLAFIGFPITKGNHQIEITYKSPWKKKGSILSGIGVLAFVILLFTDRKKKEQ